jgi:hypothetical protein
MEAWAITQAINIQKAISSSRVSSAVCFGRRLKDRYRLPVFADVFPQAFTQYS